MEKKRIGETPPDITAPGPRITHQADGGLKYSQEPWALQKRLAWAYQQEWPQVYLRKGVIDFWTSILGQDDL